MHIGYLLDTFNDDLRTGTINNLNQLKTKIQRIWRNKQMSVLRQHLNQYLIQLVHPQNPMFGKYGILINSEVTTEFSHQPFEKKILVKCVSSTSILITAEHKHKSIITAVNFPKS